MHYRFLTYLIVFSVSANAQSLGGNAVFSFLNQPNSAQLAALGGVNVSNLSNDVSLAFNNPSLLRKEMHQQINVSFNNYLAGIKNYSLTTAHYANKINTTIALGVNYFNYGTATATDAVGNISGNFSANDYVIQLSASKKYKENWFVGTTIKYLSSNFGFYKSNGIAGDIALTFIDSAHFFQAAFLVKNIGIQLKKYNPAINKEELPFDVQLGITKKLEKAPIQFSLTAHHLQQFNILYNDTLFKALEGDDSYKTKKYILEKIFTHLVFAVQIFLDNKIELTAGYNFLRRHDLNVYNTSTGLNGLNFGFGLLMKKFHFRYSSGFLQQNMYHQMGLNFSLGKELK